MVKKIVLIGFLMSTASVAIAQEPPVDAAPAVEQPAAEVTPTTDAPPAKEVPAVLAEPAPAEAKAAEPKFAPLKTTATVQQAVSTPTSTRPHDEEGWIGPMIHPEGPGAGKWRMALGGFLEVIPSQVLEAAPPTIPKFMMEARVDVSDNVGFIGSFSSQLVANELSIGAAWFTTWNKFSILIGGSFGGHFGTLGHFGFSSTAYGLLVRPTIRLGYAWKRLRVTVNLENWVYLSTWTRLGDVTTKTPGGAELMAGQASVNFESYFDDGTMFWLGLGVMLASPNYSLWEVLSDEQQRLLYPRFTFAYEF